MDHKPLFEPGFHDLPYDGLKEAIAMYCVTPFANSNRRNRLLGRFFALLKEVEQVGIFTEIWVDGSFLTDKEDPNDIDLVLFYDDSLMRSFSPREKQRFQKIRDHDQIKRLYLCDAYLVEKDEQGERRYWSRWYGHSRDGVPKGIVRINLR